MNKAQCPSCKVNLLLESHTSTCPAFYLGAPLKEIPRATPILATVERLSKQEIEAAKAMSSEAAEYVAYSLSGPLCYGDSAREAWKLLESRRDCRCLPLSPEAKALLDEQELCVRLTGITQGPDRGSVIVDCWYENFSTRIIYMTSITLPADFIAFAPSCIADTILSMISRTAEAIVLYKP